MHHTVLISYIYEPEDPPSGSSQGLSLNVMPGMQYRHDRPADRRVLKYSDFGVLERPHFLGRGTSEAPRRGKRFTFSSLHVQRSMSPDSLTGERG